MTREETRRLERALAAWPGASYEVTRTKRHERVLIQHGPNRAVIVKSSTPTCPRATDNFIADVRRALKGFEQ